ncbi:OLC1v1031141C1 [Oldenlandia corymbosa var. corymbosa]|uniref:OLC1v1031141C1 n=1 Tax=Oldenlandia corymbosa var. corymbosa TaxID=529605 RepID=A0AAV1CJM1_OLDCO|nr:OLC1v1031141C1 [Oldenlandia corymbosa var. corymbosa]
MSVELRKRNPHNHRESHPCARVSEKTLATKTEKRNSTIVGSSSGLTEKKKAATIMDIRDSPPKEYCSTKSQQVGLAETLVAGCGTQPCGDSFPATCKTNVDVAILELPEQGIHATSIEQHDPPQAVTCSLEKPQTDPILGKQNHAAATENRFALLNTSDEADCEDHEDEEEDHVEEVYVEQLDSITSAETDDVRREIGFEFSFSSENSKIWVFSRHGFMLTLLEDLEQVLHFEFTNAMVNETFYFSAVYAKSTRMERRALWQHMTTFRQLHPSAHWMIGGDFNVIRSLDEYSGSSVQDLAAISDFNDCVQGYDLDDI